MDERAIRAILFYEWKKGSSTREAADNINAALGPVTVSKSTAARWFQLFASGETRLDIRKRSGRPVELEDDALRDELLAHPDATTRELALTLGCTHGTIENRLHALGYRRVLARWTPYQLSAANLAARVSICQSLLFRPQRNDFLSNLVTGDESWVLYKNDTRTAYWLPRGEEPPTQPQPETHSRKVLLCCWWDARGMLYFELLSGQQTVTADVYTRQLRQLALAIREKRRRQSEVHLLHDNARPHVATATRRVLEDLGWDTVPHPAYSPDLAPSDYHLFRALKNSLRGRRFSDFNKLQTGLAYFFESQSAEFWERGIQSLPQRWEHVIETHGQYIVD
jgi:histone-lysine N-methyltransferase SETMAR